MSLYYKFCKLVIPIFVLLWACEREYPDPIDIFEEEELIDSVRIPSSGNSNVNLLYVNADRIRQDGDQYHIKGTIFASSQSGMIPVSNGDFWVYTSDNSKKSGSNPFSLEGYGTFEFPRTGVMSQFDTVVAEGSKIYYNTGQYFKSLDGKSAFPLDDQVYYFHYEKDTAKTKNKTTTANDTRERKLKKSKFIFREFYMDANDPKVLVLGDYVTKTATYKDLWSGFSSNYKFLFAPMEYSPRMVSIVGGLGFETFDANFFFAGKIPIKKYSLRIDGEGFISTRFGSKGEFDFFENCVEDAEYQIGCNANVYFDNKLIPILTDKKELKLGNATLQAEFLEGNAELRVAGEYSNANYVEEVLGETASKFLTSSNNSGMGYLRIGNDLDNFIMYLQQEMTLNTQLSGNLACQESVLKCTKNEFELQGFVDLPYNIGELEVIGNIQSNGKFSLRGEANAQVDVGGGVSFNSDLKVEVSDEAIAVEGNMELPYGIGDVLVKGKITTNGLYLEGDVESGVDLGNGLTLPAKLHLVIDSNKGVALSGSASLPYGIGTIDVTGSITSSELLLAGQFSSTLGFGNVDLINSKLGVSISTSTGVILNGSIVLPLEFGQISVLGKLDASDMLLTGSFNSMIGYNGIGLNSNLEVSASVMNGISLNGEIDFNAILGVNVQVTGELSKDDIQLAGIFNSGFGFNLCGVNVSASTGLSMEIGKHHGVSIAGDITFPFGGLGKAHIDGNLNSNLCFSVNGYFVQNISIQGHSINSSKLSFSGSCKNGFSISGDIDFPLGLGNISFGGKVSGNGFYIEGGTSINLTVAHPSINVRVDQSNVKIETKDTGVNLKFDWKNQEFQVCTPEVLGLSYCFP